LNFRNFTKPFICDIQSLKTIGCDRDLQPSRPRRDVIPSTPRLAKMGLETLSLISGTQNQKNIFNLQ